MSEAALRTAGTLHRGADAVLNALPLPVITVAADGSFSVDSCGPRAIVPTNTALARLLRCLASGATAPTNRCACRATTVR